MKKSSITYRIFKVALITICIPAVLLLLLSVLLYIPSIQQYAVEAICREAGKNSGYDIEIGELHLSFPLKASIADFKVSRGDTVYASGKSIDANVSLLPLFKGEIELNYISVESTRINTMDLIPNVMLQGDIGFFRAVARNINLEKKAVNLSQLHLHSTDIYIELADTAVKEKEESASTDWLIRLKRGKIENCGITVFIPSDTLRAETGIGILGIRDAVADLGKTAYTIASATLENSNARYDKGTAKREHAPLDHIEANCIGIDCRNIAYTQDSTALNIKSMTLVQPGGIRIIESNVHAVADRQRLDISRLSIKSQNGSYVKGKATLPWSSLEATKQIVTSASISAALNKKDLSAFVTAKEYEAISLFEDNMFRADLTAHGNVSHIDIDTIDIHIPSVGEIHGKGKANNLTDTKRLSASLEINGVIDDIRSILDSNHTSTERRREVEIEADITYDKCEASIAMRLKGAGGDIDTKAAYDTSDDSYTAESLVNNIDINSIISEIPIKELSMNLKVNGKGTDLLDSNTKYDIVMNIDTVQYADCILNNIMVDARQENCISHIDMLASDSNLRVSLNARTRLDSTEIRNSTTINIAKADLRKLGLSNVELGTEMEIDIEMTTDMSENHSMSLTGKNMKIITSEKRYTPKDISAEISTTPRRTYIKAANGDLNISGEMDCGYNGLYTSLDRLAAMYSYAGRNQDMTFFLQDYEKVMPEIHFDFKCGKQNMLANLLATKGTSIDEIALKLELDTVKGLDMQGGIYGFRNSTLNLDTIHVLTKQQGKRLRYIAGVRSTSVNPENEKQTFNAALYGNLCMDTLSANFIFRDRKEGVGFKLGATTFMKPKELCIHFNPDATFFGQKFRFNEDNRILLGSDMDIEANVTLSNGSDGGMRLYTTTDSLERCNTTLEIFNVNLKSATEILPFAPDIAGMLNLDLYLRKEGKSILLSSDVRADDVAYDGTYIGNGILEVVYFPKNNNHYIDIILNQDDTETLHLKGDYTSDSNNPGLNGSIDINRLPLNMAKAFIKDSGLDITGYINGELKACGRLSELKMNGHVQFDSVYMDAPLLGTSLHMTDEQVQIEDNVIRFKDFGILAKGNTPFNINGTVDMNRFSEPHLNIRMNASKYKLIDASRQRGSILYGKMYVDIRSFISGTLNNMKVRGDVALLGNSDITYVIQDAPIESDKELDGLVEFVNFKDTTSKAAPIEEELDLGNTDISLTLRIEDGARINADFDANRNSYLMLQGGGNLHMTYTNESGMNVTGTYSMSEGVLKYALPVIPLKTFNIADGSKITWTGDMFDPEIDITALERVTTSVTLDDNSVQPVTFDVGVRLSNTLSDMGLSFTMSTPENAVIQDKLNALDPETLNKYAVTMLITGTYIGGSKGMTVSSALTSFLDAKINNLAGSAMKSVNVNVGINDAQNAETGGTYKNYSFSFSKRFWNDRLTIVIGGEVNSGDHATGNDSFINNVSLEWKISDSGNRYLRLFYDKNYESLLEGEIVETGIGYVYKRKLNSLNELLIFKRKE